MDSYQGTDILTIEEVAEKLKCSKNIVYDLLREGKIKSFKIGKVWKITRAAVDEFIVESECGGKL